jgi:uncharacterized membrane protein
MATVEMREQDRMRAATRPTNGEIAASAGGGLIEVLCSLAVIALTIAGLAHLFPTVLAGIAEIVFGVALMCADAGVATRFSRFSRGGLHTERSQFTGVLGVEAIGGLAGLVLGILTLVNLVPVVLSAVVVIVFGASVIVGGAARARMAARAASRLGWVDEDLTLLQETHAAAVGGRTLVGVAAIVLGIISVVFSATIPATSLVLSLVGLLCLGVGGVLTGSAFSGQALAEANR